jgi:hypothetical protein
MSYEVPDERKTMAHIEVIQRIGAPQVIEGTRSEIAERLKVLGNDKRLTLIIPGREIEEFETTEDQEPLADKTFREIFAPTQAGFDQTGMTDEELSDFLEAEVKAYRAERRANEPQSE